jgi:hypothetical protein
MNPATESTCSSSFCACFDLLYAQGKAFVKLWPNTPSSAATQDAQINPFDSRAGCT